MSQNTVAASKPFVAECEIYRTYMQYDNIDYRWGVHDMAHAIAQDQLNPRESIFETRTATIYTQSLGQSLQYIRGVRDAIAAIKADTDLIGIYGYVITEYCQSIIDTI